MNKLDQLSEAKARHELLRMEYDAARADAMSVIHARLQEIDSQYFGPLDQSASEVSALEAEIRADVLAHGASIKGAHLQALWVKGRVSWDTKALDGYSAAHPEIERFKKVGDPSVTIRSV